MNMKIILFLALITLATCELYHYQECVRGTTVLLKEPCSSGTYEGNSPFHPLADNKFALTCFSTQFAFACPDGVKHVYQLRARSASPKLFIRQEEVQELYSPIFLIVAAIVFNTLLHTQKKDRMIELSLIDFYLCFLAFLLFLVLIMLIIFWFSLELQDHNEICHA